MMKLRDIVIDLGIGVLAFIVVACFLAAILIEVNK